MFKRFIYITSLIFVILCIITLSGCEDSNLNTYHIKYKGIFFQNDPFAKIELEVYTISTFFEISTTGQYGRNYYETSISNDGIVDTSLTGKQIFTVSIPDKNVTFNIDVYVVKLDGVYYSGYLNDKEIIAFKIDNNNMYLYDHTTDTYSDECYPVKVDSSIFSYYNSDTSEYSCDFHINSNSYSSFYLYMYSPTYINHYDYFQVVAPDYKIEFSSFGRYVNKDLILVQPIDESLCEPFWIEITDNHLTTRTINKIKNIGILTLDKEKTQIITEETIIDQEIIYIYSDIEEFDKEDYSDKPFIGKYYNLNRNPSMSVIFSIEGNEIKDYSEYLVHYNYSAKQEGDIWYIYTSSYTMKFNIKTKILTQILDDGTELDYIQK